MIKHRVSKKVVDRDHVPGHPEPSTAGLPRGPAPEKQREALRHALLQIDALKSELKIQREHPRKGTEAELALPWNN